MASLEALSRPSRDALPPINNFDFDKYRLDKTDNTRFTLPNLHTISKVPLSSPPSTMYSGPPPPYSSAPSVSNSTQAACGYISPPESSSRRSTRDEKESPKLMTSLPSISEALKSTDIQTTTAAYTAASAPGSNAGQTFADAPRGPGNPFSQPVVPASALRSSIASVPESTSIQTVPPPPPPPDTRQPPLISTLSSPRSRRMSGPPSATGVQLEAPFRSSYPSESTRPGYPFPDYHTPSGASHTSSSFHFEHQSKIDDSHNPFVKPDARPYNETVKRHLDVYDSELALNEIAEASARTHEFAKVWSQRYHQANRTSYFTDGLPGIGEVEDILKYSQLVFDNLHRLREVAIVQQTALNEQRARAAQGSHAEDDFHRMSDEYKAGGFAGGDAKKRRGKAAPPGRCHSCNRAETPEWRRGPDGARTLCNACGLHYAKLTRKMGANKAAVAAGSNLRPKSISDTRP